MLSIEAHLFLFSICSLIRRWFKPSALIAVTALFLMLATHSKSSANTVIPSVFTNNSSGNSKPFTLTPDSTYAGDSPSEVIVAESRNIDWSGVRRDTGIIFGAQIFAVGITYSLPESFSNWSPEQKNNGLKNYGKHFIDPVMDKDKFYVNYILHPYWGGAYYIRARERGVDQTSSFVYSAMMSAMYEFGVECIAEKPSIQDLVVTPVAGSLLGALVFEPWRDSIMRKQDLRWYDHAALIATDPIGVLSLGFEKLFGIKPAIAVNYSIRKLQSGSAGAATSSQGKLIEVVLKFPLN